MMQPAKELQIIHLAQEVIKKTANNFMAKAIKKQALGRGLSALLKIRKRY
jgi:uncharacterized membrane protein